jgi:hypothetical protein
VGGDVSGDEAVWRDLVARYEMPSAPNTGATPWPERENLEIRPRDPSLQVADAPAREPGSGSDDQTPAGAPAAPADGDPADGAPTDGATTDGAPADGATADGGAPDGGGPARGPAAGSPGSRAPGSGAPGSGAPGASDRRGPGPAGDRTRVVRHAHPIRQPSPADADQDDDDRYVPPPPPPLPKLDSVGKGAWAALFGGPGYLVLATILGWQVSGWAALAAVTAFVGGFATVIVRMGDGPSRGDGPDSGAVV